jgi:hypothetical protein
MKPRVERNCMMLLKLDGTTAGIEIAAAAAAVLLLL